MIKGKGAMRTYALRSTEDSSPCPEIEEAYALSDWVSKQVAGLDRKADIRLHGNGNSNSHGARPVYLKPIR